MLMLPLLGGLASCNTGSSSSGNGNGGTQGSQSTNNGKITIYFWHTCGQTVVTELERRISEFEKLAKENDGVDVDIVLQYQGSYDDILQKIRTAFSTGNQPTLAIAYPDHVAEYLAAETTPGQYVVDMTQYIDSDEYGFDKEAWIGDEGVDDFIPAFYQEGSGYARKGVYSLPLMKSTEVMYYNVNAVDSLAMEYNPNLFTSYMVEDWLNDLSWDEFMDFCTFIKGKNINNVQWPAFYDSDSNLYITGSMQENIPFLSYKEDGKGSIDFNNDQAKTFVKGLKEDYDKGLFSTKGITGEYGSNYFTNQRVLFDIGSSGGAGYNYPTGGSFEVGVCRVPSFNPDNSVYVNQGLTTTILKAKDDTDGQKALYAFKFLKYMTSTNINTELCVNGSEGYVPVRESCYETTLFQNFLSLAEEDEITSVVAKVVTDDIDGQYFNTPCFQGSAYARDSVGGLISQYLSGKVSLDKAFEDAYNNTLNQM